VRRRLSFWPFSSMKPSFVAIETPAPTTGSLS
jgi:hypothetical protein